MIGLCERGHRNGSGRAGGRRTGRVLILLAGLGLMGPAQWGAGGHAARAAGAPSAPDAVLDAKRRAAAELLRSGKPAEAIALLEEVVRAGHPDWRDHLNLGRAHDKVPGGAHAAEAVEAYERAGELLGKAGLTGAEERSAKVEVDRRLKVLSAQTTKVQAAEDEFLRRLDALEREAIAAKDARAVRRVFRLKGAMYRTGGRPDCGGVEVHAGQGWHDTEVDVRAGVTYRVRAVGTARYKSGAVATADGVPGVESANGTALLGMLIGQVDGRPGVFYKFGSNGAFTAPGTGRLRLSMSATDKESAGATGGVTVVIESQP
ncbi:MAG: hypothetical protein ACAI43_22800 [Phycisphaerae bacterium]